MSVKYASSRGVSSPFGPRNRLRRGLGTEVREESHEEVTVVTADGAKSKPRAIGRDERIGCLCCEHR